MIDERKEMIGLRCLKQLLNSIKGFTLLSLKGLLETTDYHKFSKKEKLDFIKVLVHYEIEEVEDWMNDAKIKKKVREAMNFIAKGQDLYTNFLRILNGTYDPIDFIYNTDYELIFGKNTDSISYYELLKNIGITNRKVEDLLVSLDFNVSKDSLEDINLDIMKKSKVIPIIKAKDFEIAY